MAESALTMLRTVRLFRARERVEPFTPSELSRRYLNVVLRYIAIRIPVGVEAEDVTADVFTAAFSQWEQCPSPTPPDSLDDPIRAWLFGIARRKVADVYRQRERRPEIALSDMDTEAARKEATVAQPEALTLASEAVQTLYAILETLPEDQREALRLKYIEGLSLSDIGEVLGRSPAAVGMLLHRARASVRDRSDGYFDAPESEEKSR